MMTDKEKTSLKAEIASIFDKFNILEHTATIGGLRDDILRLIDSVQDKPKFNIGDVITNGGRSVTITGITEDAYIVTNDEIENDANCVNWHIKMKDQDKWTLVENARPKFNVGDWIISEEAHKDYRICKITKIQDGCYSIESIYGFKGWNYFSVFEEIYRVWTIQDAQPGDILVYNDEYFIFKQINTGNDFFAYCKYDCHLGYDNLEIFCDKRISFSVKDIAPVEKEYCELLNRKLMEAGYRWDAKKRELKESVRRPDDNSDELESAAEKYAYEQWPSVGVPNADCYHGFKAGAGWQKEKDKIWLAENHKQIFNNGYEEGFESGRDDAYDEIMEKSVKRTVVPDENGFGCVNVPNEHLGKIVNVAILEND